MNFFFVLAFLSCPYFLIASAALSSINQEELVDFTEQSPLFRDLEMLKQIDHEIQDSLPLVYNYAMLGGYFNMPSARIGETGEIGVGAAVVKPYNIYGVKLSSV